MSPSCRWDTFSENPEQIFVITMSLIDKIALILYLRLFINIFDKILETLKF